MEAPSVSNDATRDHRAALLKLQQPTIIHQIQNHHQTDRHLLDACPLEQVTA